MEKLNGAPTKKKWLQMGSSRINNLPGKMYQTENTKKCALPRIRFQGRSPTSKLFIYGKCPAQITQMCRYGPPGIGSNNGGCDKQKAQGTSCSCNDGATVTTRIWTTNGLHWRFFLWWAQWRAYYLDMFLISADLSIAAHWGIVNLVGWKHAHILCSKSQI